MIDMDLLFQLIPHESVWVYQFGHHKSAKLGIFPKKIQNAEKCTFLQALKIIRWLINFSVKPTANGHKFPRFWMSKSELNKKISIHFRVILSWSVDSTYQKKLTILQEILVQSNKAVLAFMLPSNIIKIPQSIELYMVHLEQQNRLFSDDAVVSLIFFLLE